MALHTLSIAFGDGASALKNSHSIDAQGFQEIEVPIGALATDTEIALVVDVSQVTFFWMFCDGAVQIETNAVNAAGGQTIQLGASKNFIWESGSGIANPLTLDITKIFVTNAVNTARTLKIRYKYDATP